MPFLYLSAIGFVVASGVLVTALMIGQGQLKSRNVRDRNEMTDIQRDQALIAEKDLNLMDDAQLAEAQLVEFPEQIWVVAPNPLELVSDKIYDSTLEWMRERLKQLEMNSAPDIAPCIVFWSRLTEQTPSAIQIARLLYFSLGKNARVFDLIHCVQAPDYIFLTDFTFHHMADGTTRGFINTRRGGVTDVLCAMGEAQAVALAGLFQVWQSAAKKTELVVPDLMVSAISEGVGGSTQARSKISAWTVTHEIVQAQATSSALDTDLKQAEELVNFRVVQGGKS